MLALAYKDLADIDEVPALDDADMACMAELRDVLARHGRLDRFGVTLLHSHFPIGDNEVLVEASDDQARTLMMSVQPKDVLASASLKATSWRLSDDETVLGCFMACSFGGGSHKKKHVKTA